MTDNFLKCSEILETFDNNPIECNKKLFNLYDSLDEDDIDTITHLQYVLIEQFRCSLED